MPKTVIVLGAGASKEVGLPIGADLKNAIAERLNICFEHGHRMVSGDALIVEALRQHVAATTGSRDVNPHLNAAHRIRTAMPQAISIDNFIDAHKGDAKIEICGKLAIVAAMLAAERRSMLYIDHTQSNRELNYGDVP